MCATRGRSYAHSIDDGSVRCIPVEITLVQTLAWRVGTNQTIQFFEQRIIPRAGILGERLPVLREVIEEGIYALFVQFLPVRSIAGLLQPIRVKNLLKLVANRHGQAGLAEVQGFGDQRESGVSDHGLSTHQV